MKRIALFLATNLVIIATLTVILSVLGIDRYASLQGMFIFCLVWCMGGAFISLEL